MGLAAKRVCKSLAITKAFGDHAQKVAVSSTKSIHGHLLGATSSLELIITLLAMMESFLPATSWLEEADPKCALNHVARSPLPGHAFSRAMSFSSGFGGTNVALVVSKHPEMTEKRQQTGVQAI